ncbi:Eukaryotic translation initiation factor 3 subunit J [Pestalotiopsis fici W106-1]|uniref:Eukaryotic translation initiation factor 3 subunit J n=1 Tax=Pestalotiopsis fici (strain W106-1 / CGMCC3.15140) TaxID=1229662 RepID=W3XMD3_PESFW|nr:Eukaryotic translation initiation factor 3 subunit J [Pestalotiopsis fici W106-1]ETS87154.1 Eukaryotic translation initiation factor 3 subunit J [Pestalotiopsis fici W106-1]
MPAGKQWDEEESDSSSTPPDSPAANATVRRGKFDDEEGEDSDVLDSWDAAEDSEVEREKAKKASEAKAKADAEAAANKKSKKQRIEERIAERAAQLADESSGDEEETEAERRERLKRAEVESDLKHAADLFGDVGLSNSTQTRKTVTAGSAIPIDPKDPTKTIDMASLALFKPQTKTQFENLRNVLVPIISANHKKAHYSLFMQEFSKQLSKDLPSDQIKKIASALTALGNEKMKEEKAAEKGGKKTKAAKTKTSLVTTRANAEDMATYDDDFGDDDFM